jgi:hypothetical protein
MASGFGEKGAGKSMTDQKTINLYIIVCVVQSIAIIALSFYIGHQKTAQEELVKENERNTFALQLNASRIEHLKASLDTCGTK